MFFKHRKKVPTSVYLYEDQKEWLDKHSINLSKYLRQKIDAAMQEDG